MDNSNITTQTQKRNNPSDSIVDQMRDISEIAPKRDNRVDETQFTDMFGESIPNVETVPSPRGGNRMAQAQHQKANPHGSSPFFARDEDRKSGEFQQPTTPNAQKRGSENTNNSQQKPTAISSNLRNAALDVSDEKLPHFAATFKPEDFNQVLQKTQVQSLELQSSRKSEPTLPPSPIASNHMIQEVPVQLEQSTRLAFASQVDSSVIALRQQKHPSIALTSKTYKVETDLDFLKQLKLISQRLITVELRIDKLQANVLRESDEGHQVDQAWRKVVLMNDLAVSKARVTEKKLKDIDMSFGYVLKLRVVQTMYTSDATLRENQSLKSRVGQYQLEMKELKRTIEHLTNSRAKGQKDVQRLSQEVVRLREQTGKQQRIKAHDVQSALKELPTQTFTLASVEAPIQSLETHKNEHSLPSKQDQLSTLESANQLKKQAIWMSDKEAYADQQLYGISAKKESVKHSGKAQVQKESTADVEQKVRQQLEQAIQQHQKNMHQPRGVEHQIFEAAKSNKDQFMKQWSQQPATQGEQPQHNPTRLYDQYVVPILQQQKKNQERETSNIKSKTLQLGNGKLPSNGKGYQEIQTAHNRVAFKEDVLVNAGEQVQLMTQTAQHRQVYQSQQPSVKDRKSQTQKDLNMNNFVTSTQERIIKKYFYNVRHDEEDNNINKRAPAQLQNYQSEDSRKHYGAYNQLALSSSLPAITPLMSSVPAATGRIEKEIQNKQISSALEAKDIQVQKPSYADNYQRKRLHNNASGTSAIIINGSMV